VGVLEVAEQVAKGLCLSAPLIPAASNINSKILHLYVKDIMELQTTLDMKF
jgi:hypothetical protein